MLSTQPSILKDTISDRGETTILIPRIAEKDSRNPAFTTTNGFSVISTIAARERADKASYIFPKTSAPIFTTHIIMARLADSPFPVSSAYITRNDTAMPNDNMKDTPLFRIHL